MSTTRVGTANRATYARRINLISIVLSAVGLLLSSQAVAAQDADVSRVAATLTAGYQASSNTFSQSITFEAFSEDGSLTTDYKTSHVPVIDGGVGVRLWRGLGVGVAGSYASGTSPAQIGALIPHPFVFNQPRQINGTADVLHRELAVYVQAQYWIQAADRLTVVVSAGPSVIRTDQDFVSDVTYTQTPPYDVATYSGATVIRARATAVGGNVGAEADWRLARHLGAAAVVRYSRATADFTSVGVSGVAVGGLHFGGGVRVIF
jgi:hypothetical protein